MYIGFIILNDTVNSWEIIVWFLCGLFCSVCIFILHFVQTLLELSTWICKWHSNSNMVSDPSQFSFHACFSPSYTRSSYVSTKFPYDDFLALNLFRVVERVWWTLKICSCREEKHDSNSSYVLVFCSENWQVLRSLYEVLWSLSWKNYGFSIS